MVQIQATAKMRKNLLGTLIVALLLVRSSSCMFTRDVGVYSSSLLEARNEVDACGGNDLEVYPIPPGVATRNTFNISVRAASNLPWTEVGAYQTTLNWINTTTGGSVIHLSSMAYFDFCNEVQVSLTYNLGRVNSVRIRPDSYNIVPHVVYHNIIKFTLDQPRNLVIEVNDDIFDCLHLLTNPIETNVPSSNDPNVIYFGPGVNTVTGGVVHVASNQTVYIAGGAVLKANVAIQNVSDATVRGRGVLLNSPGGSFTVEYSNNISIYDIISLDPNGYSIVAGDVTNFIVSGLRGFSSKGNGDGIDLFSCTDAVIDNVFMRNSDDCIAIYNHRWNYYGNSTNITVQNSSLWADVAHPINVGTHGNSDDPEVIDNLVIRNIDILDHREMQMLYQGCIAFNPGDSNLIQNVLVEDVRVEDFRLGQLINMRVMYNTKYNTSPGRGISNVTIKDLVYNGTHANPSILVGYDEERTISNVQFINLTVNGLQIADTMRKPTWYLASDFVPLYANEHVLNLTFRT
ncbi:pectin lyase fold/virulence factor [Lipomyces doorenjongii]|uniref:pectin lyase fold/virulence factor n=1 Tax=Lipomyces doorenjongii TaxID=383834 RepID=UPI0034CFC3EB